MNDILERKLAASNTTNCFSDALKVHENLNVFLTTKLFLDYPDVALMPCFVDASEILVICIPCTRMS